MSSPKPIFWAAGAAVLVAVASVPGIPAPPKSPAKKPVKVRPSGEAVFQNQCAPCHGPHGEGSPAYPQTLAGSLSVGQLAHYIAQSMPPGPKKCPAADAPQVAAYVYNAFYSPLAQERNRPARIALSRLTVRQYRNAVSDLVGSFHPTSQMTAAPDVNGLQAEYFKAKRFDKNDRVLQRVDPEVHFDFGQDGPSGATFEPHQFSIRWTGSVVAPDSGNYEFVVHSEHAVRLWVNDGKKPLIDAWVKSGNDNDFRESLYLVGGRSYPLRLEFTKSTQGVDDTAKKQGKPAAKASIFLSWKCPHQSEEPIPARCLLPSPSPETFVVTTPFPPDDRSLGYERGNAVSKDWDEAVMGGALETAGYVATHLNELVGSAEDPVKLKAFCHTFVERALRRPLDAPTEKLYINRQLETAPDPVTAVKRVVLLTLQSPRFLYRELGQTDTDPYAVASRLSFALWDSLPDAPLLQAAASGQLATREQIAAQAERMASDPRAWYKERDFFHQWLKIDQYPDLAKDAKQFPLFTPQVATDLRTSLDLSLEKVVRSDRSDFRELMLSDTYYLNGRLASLYGVPSLAPDAPFQPVSLDPGVRAGILTHPYLLASFAYTSTSSPIHRGVLLTRSILGRTLQPPPAAFTPLAASLHPDWTTRQRVSMQTSPPTCMSCHGIINPLGFTLERFDAIGRRRGEENGKTIDATGRYVPRTGPTVTFAGARDLAHYVAESGDARAAFVEKLFQYTIKQPIRAYGPQTLPNLEHTFAVNGYNIRRLVADIATDAALPKSPESKVAQR